MHLAMNQDVITVAVGGLGYKDVSSEQRSVVQAFVDGRDVFVCLPTGSGEVLVLLDTPRSIWQATCKRAR